MNYFINSAPIWKDQFLYFTQESAFGNENFTIIKSSFTCVLSMSPFVMSSSLHICRSFDMSLFQAGNILSLFWNCSRFVALSLCRPCWYYIRWRTVYIRVFIYASDVIIQTVNLVFVNRILWPFLVLSSIRPWPKVDVHVSDLPSWKFWNLPKMETYGDVLTAAWNQDVGITIEPFTLHTLKHVSKTERGLMYNCISKL